MVHDEQMEFPESKAIVFDHNTAPVLMLREEAQKLPSSLEMTAT